MKLVENIRDCLLISDKLYLLLRPNNPNSTEIEMKFECEKKIPSVI